MLDNSGKITKNYKLMGTESDPVIIAQRLLNLYRQLHIFSSEKKEAYNKMLIEQPMEVKRLIGTLPGGVVVQQYLADIEKEAGITDENFEQEIPVVTNDKVSSEHAENNNQEQPRVIVQSAASPEMTREIAKAFKEALVTSDKNRKEDTKELAQTLMALQSKLTQTILEKQSKSTTESQSELIKTITHTQTQEFSAIISKALKEIRQMSNDALIEAIQKVHSENIDFFKNQIFSTVSPMPMSAHYDAKMQEYNDKYNAADDAVTLDEYVETPSPVKETAIDDISEEDYYQEMSKHKEEVVEEKEDEKTAEEEIDESLLEGFDGNPEDLFENDTEWKKTEEEPSEKEEEKAETPQVESTSQVESTNQETVDKEEKEPASDEYKKEDAENSEEQEKPQKVEPEAENTAENTDEEYEWEYVEEDENVDEDISHQKKDTTVPEETKVQAAYNILETMDEDNSNNEEYEWEYVEEDEENTDSSETDEEYEWEYVEEDETEDAEEYDFDEDPYNPDIPTQAKKEKNTILKNKMINDNQEQTNDNIILDDGFGISSNDDD